MIGSTQRKCSRSMMSLSGNMTLARVVERRSGQKKRLVRLPAQVVVFEPAAWENERTGAISGGGGRGGRESQLVDARPSGASRRIGKRTTFACLGLASGFPSARSPVVLGSSPENVAEDSRRLNECVLQLACSLTGR